MTTAFYRPQTTQPKLDETPALPSYNAMESLLDRIVLKDKHGETLIPTRLPLESLSPASQQRPSEETSDRFALSLLESQQRELDNYRQALQKMGEEMVALQQTVSKLEAEKSTMRRQLNMHEDAAKALVTAENAEILTKAELLDKFVTLKRALAQQVEESTNYRDKVLALQNHLIKFNDKERSYIEKEKERVNQQTVLQERNNKIKKLEETCRQQEMALEKMEKLLKKKLNKSPLALGKAANQSSDNPLVDALNAENQSLKAQIAQLKVDSMAESTSSPAAEKLMKELQLEKAQKRIASLEKELVNKAHEWGREKTAMRLSFGADRDDSRYRALPPLDHAYDIPSRRIDDYPDRGYIRQRLPPGHQHSRLSPLF